MESTCKKEEEETKSEGVEMVQEIEERETIRKRISTKATCKLDAKKRSGIRDIFQDGVRETQDRKEYKREELQEVQEERMGKKKERCGHQVQEIGRRSKIV